MGHTGNLKEAEKRLDSQDKVLWFQEGAEGTVSQNEAQILDSG